MGVAGLFRVINTDARFSSLRDRRHLLPETFSHTGPDPGARWFPRRDFSSSSALHRFSPTIHSAPFFLGIRRRCHATSTKVDRNRARSKRNRRIDWWNGWPGGRWPIYFPSQIPSPRQLSVSRMYQNFRIILYSSMMCIFVCELSLFFKNCEISFIALAFAFMVARLKIELYNCNK